MMIGENFNIDRYKRLRENMARTTIEMKEAYEAMTLALRGFGEHLRVLKEPSGKRRAYLRREFKRERA